MARRVPGESWYRGDEVVVGTLDYATAVSAAVHGHEPVTEPDPADPR